MCWEALNCATVSCSHVALDWAIVYHIVIGTGPLALARAERPQAEGTTLVAGGAVAAPAGPPVVA